MMDGVRRYVRGEVFVLADRTMDFSAQRLTLKPSSLAAARQRHDHHNGTDRGCRRARLLGGRACRSLCDASQNLANLASHIAASEQTWTWSLGGLKMLIQTADRRGIRSQSAEPRDIQNEVSKLDYQETSAASRHGCFQKGKPACISCDSYSPALPPLLSSIPWQQERRRLPRNSCAQAAIRSFLRSDSRSRGTLATPSLTLMVPARAVGVTKERSRTAARGQARRLQSLSWASTAGGTPFRLTATATSTPSTRRRRTAAFVEMFISTGIPAALASTPTECFVWRDRSRAAIREARSATQLFPNTQVAHINHDDTQRHRGANPYARVRRRGSCTIAPQRTSRRRCSTTGTSSPRSHATSTRSGRCRPLPSSRARPSGRGHRADGGRAAVRER